MNKAGLVREGRTLHGIKTMISLLQLTLRDDGSSDDKTAGILRDCCAIFNFTVSNGPAVWTYEPAEVEGFTAKHRESLAKGFPFIVALDGDAEKVVGYATANHYRPREGWRFTVENSIFIAPSHQGRGIAKKLMAALMKACGDLGLRQMVAVISVEKEDPLRVLPDEFEGEEAESEARKLKGHWRNSMCPSVRLHGSLGFTVVARMPSVGWKFGRWLDGVVMQKALPSPSTSGADADAAKTEAAGGEAAPRSPSPPPPRDDLLPAPLRWGHHPAHHAAPVLEQQSTPRESYP